MSRSIPVHEPVDFKYTSSKLMSHLNDSVYEHRNQLLGEILTIVDASIQDQEQRKAVKDLIRKVFYSGNYLDDTGIRYAMASLSRFLRTLRNEGSTEEGEKYQKYVDVQSFSPFGNILEKELLESELG